MDLCHTLFRMVCILRLSCLIFLSNGREFVQEYARVRLCANVKGAYYFGVHRFYIRSRLGALLFNEWSPIHFLDDRTATESNLLESTNSA